MKLSFHASVLIIQAVFFGRKHTSCFVQLFACFVIVVVINSCLFLLRLVSPFYTPENSRKYNDQKKLEPREACASET